MAHIHYCLRCGDEISRGDFDCELNRNHDYALCDDCVDSGVDPNFGEPV